MVGADDFMGRVVIKLSDLPARPQTQWYPLLHRSERERAHGLAVSGDLKIRFFVHDSQQEMGLCPAHVPKGKSTRLLGDHNTQGAVDEHAEQVAEHVPLANRGVDGFVQQLADSSGDSHYHHARGDARGDDGGSTVAGLKQEMQQLRNDQHLQVQHGVYCALCGVVDVVRGVAWRILCVVWRILCGSGVGVGGV
jgi:hypothetical protein